MRVLVGGWLRLLLRGIPAANDNYMAEFLDDDFWLEEMP